MGRPKGSKNSKDVSAAAPASGVAQTVAEVVTGKSDPPVNPDLYRPTGEAAAPGKTRASFTIGPDGIIDTQGMRTENLKRIQELLRDPRNQAALGLVKEGEPIILISAEEVAQLYDMIATVEITLAPMMRIHPQAAQQFFPYSVDEKEKLTPPTQRIISKYGPDWLLRWKDEVSLAIMLMMFTRAKFDAARKYTTELLKVEEARKSERTVDAV